MSDELFRVGEVAARTGVTVRALHHYDAIGLLSPSHRAGSGRRLYTTSDIARLQQVLSLRQLGFSLDEARDCLARPGFDPLTVLRLHLTRARAVLRDQHALCARLERLTDSLERRDEVSAADFLLTVEATVATEKHLETANQHFRLPPEQAEALAAHWAKYSPADIEAVQNEWPRLFEKVRELMAAGVDPADERARVLAARSRELVAMFTGGNPAVAEQVKARYDADPELMRANGMDPAVMDYLRRAGQ